MASWKPRHADLVLVGPFSADLTPLAPRMARKPSPYMALTTTKIHIRINPLMKSLTPQWTCR